MAEAPPDSIATASRLRMVPVSAALPGLVDGRFGESSDKSLGYYRSSLPGLRNKMAGEVRRQTMT